MCNTFRIKYKKPLSDEITVPNKSIKQTTLIYFSCQYIWLISQIYNLPKIKLADIINPFLKEIGSM